MPVCLSLLLFHVLWSVFSVVGCLSVCLVRINVRKGIVEHEPRKKERDKSIVRGEKCETVFCYNSVSRYIVTLPSWPLDTLATRESRRHKNSREREKSDPQICVLISQISLVIVSPLLKCLVTLLLLENLMYRVCLEKSVSSDNRTCLPS